MIGLGGLIFYIIGGNETNYFMCWWAWPWMHR